MSRPVIRNFRERQISVSRLMVALENMGIQINEKDLEEAYENVPRLSGPTLKERLNDVDFLKNRLEELMRSREAA